MNVVVVATLVVLGVFIAVLAAYLIVVATTLRRANRAVAKIVFAIHDIGVRAEPLNQLIDEINDDVAAVERELGRLQVPERAGAAGTVRGRRRRAAGGRRK